MNTTDLKSTLSNIKMAVKKGGNVLNPVRKLTNNAPPKYLAEKIKTLPKSSIPAD